MEPAKKRAQTCCFTGHRQIPQEERKRIVDKLEGIIISLYQQIGRASCRERVS